MTRKLRILTTNDFFGCFAPVPTSSVSLPGGEGLKATIAALREGQPTIWADTGDFSHSGPLSSLSGGAIGYRATAALGIDVAALGNHDMDFGMPLLQAEARQLGFPLLSANLTSAGLPASCMIPTAAGDIGFIGLTHPLFDTMRPYSAAPERELPMADRPIAETVREAAALLRREGAAAVIAMIHDGTDYHITASDEFVADPDRFLDLCAPWQNSVDVILAGHTLSRFMGDLGGTPILQPWPFGTEVGVINLDLDAGTRHGGPRGVKVAPGGRWTGPGAEILDSAGDDFLGRLAAPLHARAGGPAPLADFLAEAIARSTGGAASMAYTCCGEPAAAGIYAMLPQGNVTRLQIAQLVPWTDGRIVQGEVSEAELQAVRKRLLDSRYLHYMAFAMTEGSRAPGSAIIAATAGFATAHLDGLAGRAISWKTTGLSLYEAVRESLRR